MALFRRFDFFKRTAGTVLAGVIGFAGLVSGPAGASISLRDDPVFGADSVIYDDANLTHWLRLDFTTSHTYNEVAAALGTTFAGWSIASAAQVQAFGTSVGVVHGSTNPAILTNAEQLRDSLCFGCVSTSSTHVYARGLVSDTEIADAGAGPITVQQAFSVGRRLNVTPNEVDFGISGWYYADGKLSPNEGIYLVRAVPEPETYALFGIGLCLVAFLVRRRSVHQLGTSTRS
jgi:PEP-CTERM motif